jgi:hypothetical protein
MESMRRWAAAAMAGALLGAPAGDVLAQGPVTPYTDACEPRDTVDFDVSSAELDLTAQSNLAGAANWAMAAAGRFLVVAGPLPSEDPLGPVRAQVAAGYLVGLGVNPGMIAVSTFDALRLAERYALPGPDSVVVLTCGFD